MILTWILFRISRSNFLIEQIDSFFYYYYSKRAFNVKMLNTHKYIRSLLSLRKLRKRVAEILIFFLFQTILHI